MEINTKIIERLVNYRLGRSLLQKAFYFVKKDTIETYKSASVLNYCEKNNIPIKVIQDDKYHEVVVFPKVNGRKEMPVRKKKVPIYPIFTAEVQNAIITGATDGILTNGYILNDRVDFIRENAFGPRPFLCISVDKNGEYVLMKQIVSKQKIEKGLCLVGRFPVNWWHLTYELLSKIQLFDMDEQYAEWPIIVDEVAVSVESNRKLLECLNVKNHPIITIKENEQFEVGKLAYASCPVTEIIGTYADEFLECYTPYNTYLFNNELSISYIRKCVLKGRTATPTRKIFVARARKGRLVNETEIAQYLEKHGFEVLYSDHFSFEEEVEVFANAKILISTMGAAMTNIVYCSPGATVVSIFPLSGIPAIGMYQEIANIIGIEFYNQDARIVKTSRTYDGLEYELSIEACKALLHNLGV